MSGNFDDILNISEEFYKIAQQQSLPGMKKELPLDSEEIINEPEENISDEEISSSDLARHMQLERDLAETIYTDNRTKELPGFETPSYRRTTKYKYIYRDPPSPSQLPDLKPEHLVYHLYKSYSDKDEIIKEPTEEQYLFGKKYILAYDKFKDYYIKQFYPRYIEAKILSNQNIENYELRNLKTKDLFEALIHNSFNVFKVIIGNIFGEHKSSRSYSRSSSLKKILNGEVITNIIYVPTDGVGTYSTTYDYIRNFNDARQDMQNIVDRFDQLKRFYKKLVKALNEYIQQYKSPPMSDEYDKLFAWIDNNQPELKDEIIKKYNEEISPTSWSIKNPIEGLRIFKDSINRILALVRNVLKQMVPTVRNYTENKIIEHIGKEYHRLIFPTYSKVFLLCDKLIGSGGKSPTSDDFTSVAINNAEEIASVYSQVVEDLRSIGINISAIDNFISNVGDRMLLGGRSIDNDDLKRHYSSDKDGLREKTLQTFRLYFIYEIKKLFQREVESATKRKEATYQISLESRLKYKSIEDFIKRNSKKLDAIAMDIVKKQIAMAMPHGEYYSTPYYSRSLVPNLEIPLRLISTTGSLSPSDIYKHFIKILSPQIPKEVAYLTIKTLFKSKNFELISKIMSDNVGAYKFLGKVLLILNKLDHNRFIKYMSDDIIIRINNIMSHMPRNMENKGPMLLAKVIRSDESFKNDVENFLQLINVIHNSANNISPRLLSLMLNNVNLKNLKKINLVEKIYYIIIRLGAFGGLNVFKRSYAGAIKLAKKQKLISNTFVGDIEMLIKLFSSNVVISPQMPDIGEITELARKIESSIDVIIQFKSYADLYNQAKENKKLKELFNLNMQINNRLRFRVLKDLDPLYFKVGILTDCCQYAGGAGHKAMEDSFINSEAGVVVLEWLNENKEWVVLGQSYFHYVPGEKGYILDNVELATKLVKESEINIEKVYAYWASKIKAKYKISYFQSGKNYSDLNASSFSSTITYNDPRSFAVTDPYTDWRPGNANIDLLHPLINIEKINPEKL